MLEVLDLQLVGGAGSIECHEYDVVRAPRNRRNKLNTCKYEYFF